MNAFILKNTRINLLKLVLIWDYFPVAVWVKSDSLEELKEKRNVHVMIMRDLF